MNRVRALANSAMMLLVFALLQMSVAVASSGSGDVVAFGFAGASDKPTFLFSLSPRLVAPPACNTTARYSINPRSRHAFIAITLLMNLHTPGVWKMAPTVRVFGTGECSEVNNAENVSTVDFYEGDQLVCSLGESAFDKIAKVLSFDGKLDSLLGERPSLPDANHSAPPFIRNMAPAKQTHTLERVVTNFHNDLCGMSLMDALEKWGTDGTKPTASERFALTGLFPGVAPATQTVSCAFLKSKFKISSYAEYVRNDSATVIWRDDSGQFEGVALFRENGNWKVDLNNRTI